MTFKGALAQIIIVGLVAFCCPGFFNALTGLGGAGGSNPDAGNSANTALYACFAVVGYFGGALYSVFGNRILVFAGGLTYAIYAAAMYVVGNVDGTAWLAPVAGALLGIGAACFWTAQGAMMMSYSTPTTKGYYIAIFWILFNLGGCLGGLLQFGINFNQKKPAVGHDEDGGQANAASYFTFIVVMCVGSVLGLLMLCKPSEVVKEDNTSVKYTQRPVCEEIKGALAVCTNEVMLLLTLTFLSSNWYYTYQLNYLNGFLFTVRTRGFNSAMYWGMQMFSSYAIGIILDSTRFSRRRNAYHGYLYVFVTLLTFWVLSFIVSYTWEEKWDKDHPLPAWDRIDITDSSRAVLPMLTLFIGGVADAGLQTLSYWLMGAIAGSDSNLTAQFAGYYKGIQSAGNAVAWALDLEKSITYKIQLVICFVLWITAAMTCFWACHLVKEDPTALSCVNEPEIATSQTQSDQKV